MILFIQIFLVLYGIIALGTGFLGIITKFDPSADPMQDNNHRYVAAMWASMSLAFFYVAWDPSEVALFRYLMVAVFIGGIVRSGALINYRPTPVMIFGILIELIPTALMLWMHTMLLNSGAL